MIITHNMAALNANRIQKNNANRLSKSTTKLSSGYRINVAADDASGNAVNVEESQAVGMDTNYANTPFANFIEKAATDAVASLYSKFGGSLFTNSSSPINIGLNLTNMDGAGGTLASAALSMSASSTSATMAYTMNVDKADYDAADFATMTEAQKADLAATIAHEMTHLVMFDTLTDGMLNSNVESFPQWFVEGMAQTSSGDGGWVSNRISSASTDAQIENYMSQLSSMPYGAGYLGTMYLGYAAGSGGDMQGRIVDGLNKVFTSLTEGKTLDEAIADNTGYAGLSDFESAFKSADTDSLAFVKDLLTERGTGAGSLLASGLDVTEEDAFAESTLTDTHNNYIIKSDNTKYMNAFGTGYTFPEKQTGVAGSAGDLMLQIGASEGQGVAVQRFDASTDALLAGENIDVTSHALAGHSIEVIDGALDKVSSIRSYYGAMQNRLEKAISNLDYTGENLQAAESRIRDVDMADEMLEFSKNNILLQAAQSMLAQANKAPQEILGLLQ